MTAAPEERDLAHEADMERLRREQLRADISPEDAAEECADEWEARDQYIADYDGDDGQWSALATPTSAPVQAEGPAPDIPPGCEMARGWAVEVSAHGERVLLLSDEGYCGLADIEPWVSTIRGCAEHLQAFIGPRDPVTDMESLETGEGDAL